MVGFRGGNVGTHGAVLVEAHRSGRQAETPLAPEYVQASDVVARLPSESAIVSATTAVMPANVTDLMTRACPSVEPGQP